MSTFKGTNKEGTPVFDGEPTLEEVEAATTCLPNQFTLPSQFQIGDEVVLDFNEAGIIYNAAVVKTHFSESKVMYDVEILTKITETKDKAYEAEATRLYNIDSVFVKSPEFYYIPQTDKTNG